MNKVSQSGTRHNRRRVRPPSPIQIILLLLLASAALILGVGGGVYLFTSRNVTVIVDGNRIAVRTYQATVDGLLSELRMPLRSQDTVSPDANTAIKSGMVITVQRANTVVVTVDGKAQQVYTRSTNINTILREAAITINGDAQITADNQPLQAWQGTEPPHQIDVRQPRPIRINDNGTVTTVNTIGLTVGDALADAKITLYVADTISPEPAALIGDDALITITRSVGVQITADGRVFTTRTHGKTVGAVLADAGLVPMDLDYVMPDPSTAVTENMQIRVVRVVETQERQESALPFKRILQADPTIPIDTRQIIQQGAEGIQALRVRIRREDGVEVSRSQAETVIERNSRDEIVAVGTMPVIKTMDTPDGSIQYWRVINMRTASYKPSSTGKDPADPTYGITATGEKLRKGIVAVDPNVIPLGTKLYIPGYGFALAADTGGLVSGRVIDLGYSDEDYKAWSGSVDIFLLVPAPPPDEVPLLPEEPVQP